ncbi:CLUMA_CG005596, isoform A [Clunio marinus]|uniref:CLUMA_CG005596, isoform A n=1 Tax=Clunio marinus TaxID=568069 RepID=A0A1J1HVB1_9DIPT|nr:CLUMA_CG005596, isoform A [Clunio marinus]
MNCLYSMRYRRWIGKCKVEKYRDGLAFSMLFLMPSQLRKKLHERVSIKRKPISNKFSFPLTQLLNFYTFTVDKTRGLEIINLNLQSRLWQGILRLGSQSQNYSFQCEARNNFMGRVRKWLGLVWLVEVNVLNCSQHLSQVVDLGIESLDSIHNE